MIIKYEGRELEFIGIEKQSRKYYTFRHAGEIIWLFKRNEKWRLGWGGSPKFEGKNYEWFGNGGDEKRVNEGEKFAEYLFEKSKLRLNFLYE